MSTPTTGDEETRARLSMSQLGAYILIVGVALLGFWRIDNSQDTIDAQQEQIADVTGQMAVSQGCTETFLARTVQVADTRTNITGEVQKADMAQNVAWADYVALELDAAAKGKDITEAQALAAVKDYFDKLKVYLDALEKAETNREQQPYPDTEAYRYCLEQNP